jgi:hypothetical protein
MVPSCHAWDEPGLTLTRLLREGCNDRRTSASHLP